MKIPFLDLEAVNRPHMAEITEAVGRVIKSGRYIGGEETMRLEQRMSDLCRTRHAIGTSNGYDSLRLIFEGLKVTGRLRDGDSVIVPANTCIASALAVSNAGLKPVFIDPDPKTMCIDGNNVTKALSDFRGIKALLTVHLYGRTAWDKVMEEACAANGITAVEDCAQSIGALYTPDRPTGSLGTAAAFSFYPTKNVGAMGDAGCVTTSDTELAAAIRSLANYGSDRRNHNIHTGSNCRLDPVQAAVLNVKLRPGLFGAITERRIMQATAYCRLINNPYITLPLLPAYHRQCVWHQFVIRTVHRDALRGHLSAHGIETDIHYPVPVHRQPCYADKCRELRLPVSEELSGSILSLPINDALETAGQQAIADAINSWRPLTASRP